MKPIYDIRTKWPTAAWYAYCLINDHYNRPVLLNSKLQNYAVDNGIVFG